MYCIEASLHLGTSSSCECGELVLKSVHFSQHAVPLMWLTGTSHTIKSVHEMAVSCLYKAISTVFQFTLFFLQHELNPKWMEASSIMDGSMCWLPCTALITAFSSRYWKLVLMNECRCSLFQCRCVPHGWTVDLCQF